MNGNTWLDMVKEKISELEAVSEEFIMDAAKKKCRWQKL